MRRILSLAIGLALSGCVQTEVLRLEGAAPRPPQDPAEVELLLDAPERPYRSIALLATPQKDLFTGFGALQRKLVRKAAQLGADAVIVQLESADGDDEPGTRLIGRAIVYTGGG